MGALSKRKGARGELEFAAWLRENLGLSAVRGRQYRGGPDSPDVRINDAKLHVEVKRSTGFRVFKSLEQAAKDCPNGHTPFVAHRPDRKDWIIVLEAKHLKNLVLELNRLMQASNPDGQAVDNQSPQAQ